MKKVSKKERCFWGGLAVISTITIGYQFYGSTGMGLSTVIIGIVVFVSTLGATRNTI